MYFLQIFVPLCNIKLAEIKSTLAPKLERKQSTKEGNVSKEKEFLNWICPTPSPPLSSTSFIVMGLGSKNRVWVGFCILGSGRVQVYNFRFIRYLCLDFAHFLKFLVNIFVPYDKKKNYYLSQVKSVLFFDFAKLWKSMRKLRIYKYKFLQYFIVHMGDFVTQLKQNHYLVQLKFHVF